MKDLIKAFVERYRANTPIKCCAHKWETMLSREEHKNNDVNDIIIASHHLIVCKECGTTQFVQL